MMQAASSGRLVPSATMVRPMTRSLTPMLCAIDTAPQTSILELASSISNDEIDGYYEKALAAGALGGKVSGAGGGGFMMFFVPPDKRMDVIRALNHIEGQVSNCHFTKNGTQAWKIL